MIGTRGFLTILATLVLVAGAGAITPLAKKPKTEAQVKRLIETVRTDPDEKKRRAALVELQEVDPRAHPDVVPALAAVLQKDASAQVRAEAAEAIGQFRIVYPLAGLALEAAAELDSVKSVRESAQQALWEYHLAGYRSPRGVDGIAGQTVEPPLAKPASVRPVTHASVVVPAPPRSAVGELPPIASQPPVAITAVRPAPKASTVALKTILSPVAMMRSVIPTMPLIKKPESVAPAMLTLTPEPPLARRRVLAVAPEPSIVTVPPAVTVRASSPEFELPLPPISTPPDAPLPPAPMIPTSMPASRPR